MACPNSNLPKEQRPEHICTYLATEIHTPSTQERPDCANVCKTNITNAIPSNVNQILLKLNWRFLT